jgi:hypothetical protein
MQWRNGNAVSCNLITSGFDSRLHVQDHVQDRSRSSTGRASGFYPQGSGFETSRERQFLDVDQPEDRPCPKREAARSSRAVEANPESEREGSRAPPAKRSVAKAMSIVRSALRHAVMV